MPHMTGSRSLLGKATIEVTSDDDYESYEHPDLFLPRQFAASNTPQKTISSLSVGVASFPPLPPVPVISQHSGSVVFDPSTTHRFHHPQTPEAVNRSMVHQLHHPNPPDPTPSIDLSILHRPHFRQAPATPPPHPSITPSSSHKTVYMAPVKYITKSVYQPPTLHIIHTPPPHPPPHPPPPPHHHPPLLTLKASLPPPGLLSSLRDLTSWLSTIEYKLLSLASQCFDFSRESKESPKTSSCLKLRLYSSSVPVPCDCYLISQMTLHGKL